MTEEIGRSGARAPSGSSPKTVEPQEGLDAAHSIPIASVVAIDDALRAIGERGARAANHIADLVEANQLERESILALERLTRHGHKFADLRVRKDARETVFQLDWIARLFRNLARGMEAGTGETASCGLDAKRDSPVAAGDAPKEDHR